MRNKRIFFLTQLTCWQKQSLTSLFLCHSKKGMRFLLIISLSLFLISGCKNSGLRVNKGEIIPYLSNAYGKTKEWFRSGNADNTEALPPYQQSHPQHKNIQDFPSQQKSTGMTKQDYSRAVVRLKKSIPDLEKRHGKQSREVGDTLYTIASMLELNGQREEAKAYFIKSEAILSKCFGSEHPNTRKIRAKIKSL